MRRNKGFTLVELMIVMAVIAVLATIALFGLRRAQQAARDTERHAVMNGMQVALQNYYGDSNHYGSTTAVNFCLAVTMLVSTGHLAAAPNDPGTQAAICGAGNPTVGGATYTFAGANSQPCTLPAGTCWQTYTLTLTKESGGSSVYTSPQ